jgi:RNA polymerase sigma factor (sigma-70 family)
MERSSDVNPLYDVWKSSTGQAKDLALTQLVPRLEQFAKAICWKRIPEFHDEFDPLINEIVWRAVGKPAKFEGKSRFSTWFYRIVTNECNRFLRKHKERNEAPLEEEMPCQAEAVNARLTIQGLIRKLTKEEYALFRMVADGESFKTIGDELGISTGNAKIRWLRLKTRLRNAT